MNVLIISGSFPNMRCGVADYVEQLTERLVTYGVKVTVLTSSDSSIRRLSYVDALVDHWDIRGLFKMLFYVKKKMPDLINLQIPTIKYKAILSFTGFFPLLSKLLFQKVPFIVTMHDYAISRPYSKIFFLPLFLFSDTVVVTNDEDFKSIMRFFPFLNGKLKKIYMGPTVTIESITDEEKREFYKKVSHNPGTRFITTMGYVKKDRHLDVIIEAFSRLSIHDDKLKLIIIGDVQRRQDEKYRNYLFRLVDRLNLKARVYILGFCSHRETSFYLSISDLSILLYERGASFRRTAIINSVVRNVPILTNVNRVYGIDNELVSSAVTMVVDRIDADEIYDKAKQILYDKELTYKLKQNSESHKWLFDWDRSANILIDLYAGLIAARMPRNARKILIIKLWAIGEVALSTPCIGRLKKEFPDAEIYFLVGKRAKDIVVGNPDIKKVIDIDEDIFLRPNVPRLFILLKDLRDERFDTIITLHHSAIFSLFTFLIGAEERIGLKRPGTWSLNTASVISDGATMPKIFEYLKPLELLAVTPSDQNADVMIYPDIGDKKRVSHLMVENDLKPKEFVLLSPTGGENPAASRLKSNIVNKVWPLEHYKKLCYIILNNSNFKVVLMGAEEERARADYIRLGFGGKVIDLTGKTNLRELVLLGMESAIAITNDSGPMHLLSASHSPVIAIFGPTDPNLICPPSENITVIREDVNCSPCFDPITFPNRVKDCKDPICMERVTPEKVFQKICEILNIGNKNL